LVVGDLHSGVLVSAADRASKPVLLRRVNRKTSEDADDALVDMPGNLKVPPLTVTSDNGREFAGRARVAEAVSAGSCFPDACGSCSGA